MDLISNNAYDLQNTDRYNKTEGSHRPYKQRVKSVQVTYILVTKIELRSDEFHMMLVTPLM